MLKQTRQRSGLKVAKIAKELGVSRAQYYNYENGKTAIKKDKLHILSIIFKMPISVLEKEVAKKWQKKKKNYMTY